MNQKQIFDELNAIAAEIEQAETPWHAAWSEFSSAGSSQPVAHLVSQIERATKDLNDFIATKVEEIARVTNNSVENIRMGFGPREALDVWFHGRAGHGDVDTPPSWFLRKVALHKSFNTNYWAQQELAQERQAFLSKRDPQAPVVSPDEAARIMKEGGVPCVAADDTVRGRPLMKFEKEPLDLSRLERAMVRAGLLKQYDKAYVDRVSPTRPVAFCLVDDHGRRQFVHWTARVASSRMWFEPTEEEPAASLQDSRPRPERELG